MLRLQLTTQNVRCPTRLESVVLIEKTSVVGKAMGEALSSSSGRLRQVGSSGDPLIELLTFCLSRELSRPRPRDWFARPVPPQPRLHLDNSPSFPRSPALSPPAPECRSHSGGPPPTM